MSKHSADWLDVGLPKRSRTAKNSTARLANLDGCDLRDLVRQLAKLRGYFESPACRDPIDATIEIVRSLHADWIRQSADRMRDEKRRDIASQKKR